MRLVAPEELRGVVARIFQSRGVSERDSEIVANCLVHANLRGVDSHGAIRVPHYISRIEAGSIKADAQTKPVKTGASTAAIDGDNGLGHVAAWDAMSLAIEMARETGTGFVGVNNSSHCGALSFFGMQAVDAGMIGMVFTQTDKGVVPFGGRLPFCGTNPLCFAIPTRSGPPVVLDMATSTVAGGHVYKARSENREIPPTWALDENGQPTTDPHKAAYWTPAAGAKGYSLGVIVDLLTGVLSGGAFGPHIPVMYGDLDKPRGLCHLAVAVDYKRFAGGDAFLDQAARMVCELHDVPPAEGFDSVLAPGEPQYIMEMERSKNGIPVEDYVWDDLMALESGKKQS